MAKLTGQRTVRLLGEEAQALADHLDELPTVIAEIDALVDEVSLRRAKVAMREAQREFRKLGMRLRLAVAELTQLYDFWHINDAQECVEVGPVETSASR
ncbi:MAG: hypothetical protein GXP29_05890 [Planctomycetes bacterium]|nr:hypothetical protein [Planctomycetota bacterium]